MIYEREDKGITLIALVVTIIVLLILAGVSISTLTGNNGLLSKAEEAKTKTKAGEEREQIALVYTEALLESEGGNVETALLKEKLDKAGFDKVEEVDSNGNIKVTINDKNYWINVNGYITDIEPFNSEN